MRVPILGAVILILGGCATTEYITRIPPIYDPPVPEWTRLTVETPCIEYTEAGRCVAWKLSRPAYDQLVQRDAEMQAYIEGLKRIIAAHNSQATQDDE